MPQWDSLNLIQVIAFSVKHISRKYKIYKYLIWISISIANKLVCKFYLESINPNDSVMCALTSSDSIWRNLENTLIIIREMEPIVSSGTKVHKYKITWKPFNRSLTYDPSITSETAARKYKFTWNPFNRLLYPSIIFATTVHKYNHWTSSRFCCLVYLVFVFPF